MATGYALVSAASTGTAPAQEPISEVLNTALKSLNESRESLRSVLNSAPPPNDNDPAVLALNMTGLAFDARTMAFDIAGLVQQVRDRLGCGV